MSGPSTDSSGGDGSADDTKGIDAAGDGGLSRRALLTGGTLAGVGGLAAYYLNARPDDRPPRGEGPPPTERPTPSPFDIWDEARAALRASPDHLPGTAETLVADSDPRAIYEFVRDDIATQPPRADANYGFNRRVNGGARAALRAGMGTPREKADLLADLLGRAGYEAAVVRYGRGLAPEQMPAIYLGAVDRAFEPGADREQFAAWRRDIGVTDDAVEEVPVVDADGAESTALATRLREQLPVDAATNAMGWRRETTPDSVPVVRFREPDSGTASSTSEAGTGAVRYADMFHEDETFGELTKPNRVSEMEDQKSRTVSVRLQMATSDAPDQRTELVSGEWDAQDLAGRQLAIKTLPGISPFDYPAIRFADVSRFVPSLAVHDPHGDEGELESLSVVGDAVDLTGDRFAVEDDGTVTKNGTVLLDGTGGDAGGDGTTPAVPDVVTDVDSLEVDVGVGGYPRVRVDATPRDANGEPIERLPANAFETTEDDEPVAAGMQANTTSPTVIVAYDTSASMILSGFYQNERQQFRERMRQNIQEVDPGANVEFYQAHSDAWKHMAEVATRDADLLVYLSDGDGYHDYSKTPEHVTAVREGPPGIMLSVTGESYRVAEDIADLTGGTVVAENDSGRARDAIKRYVSNFGEKLSAYTFTYRGSPEAAAGSTHTVTVSLPDADVSTEVTYEVPSSSIDPRTRRSLCSLFLEVDVGGTTVERTLAGRDPRLSDAPPTDADRNEVLSTFFGGHVLSFESAGVTPTVHVADQFAGMGSLEPVERARQSGDVEAMQSAVKAGNRVFPELPSRFHPHLPDRLTDDTITYSTGLRTVLYSQRFVFGTDRFEQSVDLLNTANTRTLTRAQLTGEDDHERAFRLTMERTARLAVLERELFDESTASMLSAATLRPAGTGMSEWSAETRSRFEEARRRNGGIRSDHQLVAPSGATAAFWNVAADTGAVTGILPDGSGGGKTAQRVKRTIKLVTTIASTFNTLLATAGSAVPGKIPGGTSLSIAAAYFIMLSKLYGIATVSLATTTSGGLSREATIDVATFVCDAATSIALGFGGSTGALADYMNNLHGIANGSTAFGCGDVID